MKTAEYFRQQAIQTASTVKSIREWLHQHPELSFNETQTAAFISAKLTEWNIPHKTQVGGNGIVAWIKGKQEGKTIGLRADIDALPVEEKNNLPFNSQNKGIMHACGHDVHTATLLGALYLLHQIKDVLCGTIYGIFQPAEEKLPGGAIAMLNDPFLQAITFDAVIAQHTYPDLPANYVGLKAGAYMASTDEIYVTISGKGGHAATPHQINDTVLTASQIVISLQNIVSRKAKPTIPTVLSFGKLIANGATNIIPNEVKLEGTFRTFDEAWRKEALTLISSMITTIAQANGCKADVNIVNGYPSLFNNPNLCEEFIPLAKEYLADDKVVELEMRTTAEDFSYFAQRFPSLMYRLGTGGEEYCSYPLHSPNFNVNEQVFSFAHGLLAYVAYKLL